MGDAGSLEQLVDDLTYLDEWEDRYRYIIELGKELTPLIDADKNDSTKVKGCVSQVWLKSSLESFDPPRLVFQGESDAHIVNGLIAILLRLFNHKSPDEILVIDAQSLFHKIGLDAHLSPQRSNGLVAMVNRIHHDASHIAETSTAT
jgi:cysteine desulfuration protein SufE